MSSVGSWPNTVVNLGASTKCCPLTYRLVFSIGGFVLLYSALLVVDLWLMTRFARLGPSTLGTGRYFFERKA